MNVLKMTNTNKIIPRKPNENDEVSKYKEVVDDESDIEVIVASKLEHFM